MEDVEKGTSRSRRTKDNDREWSYLCRSTPKVVIKNVKSLTLKAHTRVIQSRTGYLYLLINDGKASRALFLSFMVQGSSVETRPQSCLDWACGSTFSVHL